MTNIFSSNKDLLRSELAFRRYVGTARSSISLAWREFTRRSLAQTSTSRVNPYWTRSMIFITSLFFILPLFSSVQAAKLDFSPNSKSVVVGESFEISTTVDTSGVEILGVDALIEYDPEALTVDTITDGTFLKIGKKETGTLGKIYVAGVVEDPGSAKSGTGTLATLKFTAKKDSSTQITYICELGETNESNISKNDVDATDIIECAQNGTATIIVGGLAGPATTGTPPSTLPRSGAVETMMTIGLLGGVLLLIGGGAWMIR